MAGGEEETLMDAGRCQLYGSAGSAAGGVLEQRAHVRRRSRGRRRRRSPPSAGRRRRPGRNPRATRNGGRGAVLAVANWRGHRAGLATGRSGRARRAAAYGDGCGPAPDAPGTARSRLEHGRSTGSPARAPHCELRRFELDETKPRGPLARRPAQSLRRAERRQASWRAAFAGGGTRAALPLVSMLCCPPGYPIAVGTLTWGCRRPHHSAPACLALSSSGRARAGSASSHPVAWETRAASHHGGHCRRRPPPPRE